jgi:Fe-S-cluster-containing hydrogenase component 2
MYAVDYALPALAAREYATLGAAAAACLGCSGAPCLGACPSGIPIQRLGSDAQRRLADARVGVLADG